jgi:hypothetical protein
MAPTTAPSASFSSTATPAETEAREIAEAEAAEVLRESSLPLNDLQEDILKVVRHLSGEGGNVKVGEGDRGRRDVSMRF